jgi:hypothetical protein
MDTIKESFKNVKEDIDSLKFEIDSLREEMRSSLESIIQHIKRTQPTTPTDNPENPTIQQRNPTETQIPTDDLPSQAPITPKYYVSTGNGGVPTDRQTDRQTDTPTHQEFALIEQNDSNTTQEHTQKFALSNSTLDITSNTQNTPKITKIDQLERVSEILNSLDEIKKDLRHKFKRLTHQEMLVFSAIYQLEEQKNTVDYSTLALKLSLSESSIRDYVLKISKKGIPIDKIKENNKKILLKIPADFKKIASLQTILTLREL